MAGNAEEFFGQAFNEVPKAEVAPEREKTLLGKAMDFFGVDFSSKDSKPVAKRDTGIKPISGKFEQVFEKLIQAESRGKHMDESGKLTTSPAGAQGITQLMPATAKKPGFGIEPVKDTSESEYKRVGKEYLQALVGEFGGDFEKAVAAYNAGPANVKKAVEKGGDKWKDFLPKKSETIPYLERVLGEQAQLEGGGKAPEQSAAEKQVKFTIADIAKKGLLTEEGLKKFEKSIMEEYRKGQEGLSRKELDKYYSGPGFMVKDKRPDEWAMYQFSKDFLRKATPRQIAAIGYDVPFSTAPSGTSMETAGFVYFNEPDRAFINPFVGDTSTLVHEKEHLTTQREIEDITTIGRVGRLDEPVPQMKRLFTIKDSKWFASNKVMQEVFRSSNALDSNNEFLANIAAYEASLPEGQSIYESKFASELQKKYGERTTKEFLDQAVAYTLTNKGRVAESDFEFDTTKLDKDDSYARQVYQYLKQKFEE